MAQAIPLLTIQARSSAVSAKARSVPIADKPDEGIRVALASFSSISVGVSEWQSGIENQASSYAL